MEVAFIHPDMGLGGAEQLVVNLALALLPDIKPTIFTPRFTKSFRPCHDGTLRVVQHGTFFGLLPRHIAGRFFALMAYIRTMLCALWVVFFGHHYDLFIVDQISPVVPLLKLFGRKVLFYCHFPDKALCTDRRGLKRIYRFVIDLWQQLSLLFADEILVNSLYTKEQFYSHFPILRRLKIKTKVLYPAIDLKQFEPIKADLGPAYFLSLNRYQRKKNINLALYAFKDYCDLLPESNTRLKIAGGYDTKVQENVQHFVQLQQLAKKLGISQRVDFLRSIDDETRRKLLSNTLAVLYTPENQHFGIVPCQAMAMKVPVLACRSGGPAESIKHGVTGYLLDSVPLQWAQSMKQLGKDPERARKMGECGRARVGDKFALGQMRKGLMAVLITLLRLRVHE